MLVSTMAWPLINAHSLSYHEVYIPEENFSICSGSEGRECACKISRGSFPFSLALMRCRACKGCWRLAGIVGAYMHELLYA